MKWRRRKQPSPTYLVGAWSRDELLARVADDPQVSEVETREVNGRVQYFVRVAGTRWRDKPVPEGHAIPGEPPR